MTRPPLPPTHLRCAYTVNPLAVAPERVRLSWMLTTAAGQHEHQRGYQIRVAPSEEHLHAAQDAAAADLTWNSGRVDSASSVDIPYRGNPLSRGSRYAWAVRVWNDADDVSPWSEPASFEVELDPASWRAVWITADRSRERHTPAASTGRFDPIARALTPVPYLRREFHVSQHVVSARLYVTACGLYEARLNGSRVGDAVLTPGWTDYAQRIQYQTYDVTGMVHEGANVLGALLADGWYSGFAGFDAKRAGAIYGEVPELLAQLWIRLADGSEQLVVSDDQWVGAYGAIRHADLLMGERQDLSKEPVGWDCDGFNADAWLQVRSRERGLAKLVCDPGPAVRVTQEIGPVSITADGDGRQVIDFGQNLAGWVRIRYSGPAGQQIRIRHAEVLNTDGTLYTDNLRTARQTDEYVTVEGAQVLEPHFTVHGFRYAEVSGYPGNLDPSGVVARVAHSDIAPTGTFQSSRPWLDELFALIDWGQRSNFISVPTDCPQRDERLGWLGDAQIFARTACLNRDVAAFFAKWLDDVADAQLPSGAYPDIAPRLNLEWGGAPAWGDAGVIIPWTLYRMYGDIGNVQRHYPSMTAWMDFLERGNPDFLRTRELGNNYNDWLMPGADLTPPELLATAYWAYDAALMSEMAEALNRPADATAYQALRAKIGAEFADTFVAADGTITSGTQTAYLLGLHMQLVPEDLRAAAAEHLVDAIEHAGWRLTTGFVGVGYLLPVLSSTGYSDVAYKLLEQDALPSWRYMIDHGATTIWERWDAWTTERGFQSAWMNSFNHYALGSVGEWLYRFVLGIELAPDGVAFDRLVIRPHPGGSLTWAKGSYNSVRGRISTGWEYKNDALVFRVELPCNTRASVHVPSPDALNVRDGHGNAPVRVAGFPGAIGVHEAVFEVGPGIHEFTGRAHRDT